MFDWDPEVVEVLEQFPLDPLVTKHIAEVLGIRPPGYNMPDGYVMTTDFLVRYKRRGGFFWRAYQIKSSRSDTAGKRAQEKLRLEQEYWKQKEIPWSLLFSEDFNKTYCRNLDRLSTQRNRRRGKMDLRLIESFCRQVCRELPEASRSELSQVVLTLSDKEEISGWDAFLALAARQKIFFPIQDMDIDDCMAGDFRYV